MSRRRARGLLSLGLAVLCVAPASAGATPPVTVQTPTTNVVAP